MNSINADKLRGGYYTPTSVASWMTTWAAPLGTETILEPSCGDGNFLVACNTVAPKSLVTAVEFDNTEAEKARRRAADRDVINADFFDWFTRNFTAVEGSYDAVVGNPPFIRYQNFPDAHRERAFEIMRSEGLRPTKLTNAWLPFVICATIALREGGRLAMVLPAELLQVGYAGELRSYLTRKYATIHLISFENLIFPGILQEVVLVLAVRKDCEAAQITTSELTDATELARLAAGAGIGTIALGSAEKWTKYYLSPDEIELLRECQSNSAVGQLSGVASVDVGIVTGRNEFFVMRPSDAGRHGVTASTQPLVGRSAQIPGLRIGPDEWLELHDLDSRVLLYNPGTAPREALAPADQRYIELGEAAGYDTGYKCRIRKPTWWAVPSVWNPDAFLLRQIYDGPRVVVNAARAASTDTIHRVSMTGILSAAELASIFCNSLTWAFAEVRGRSYGGGVLELEPTEAESLPVPVIPRAAPELDKLDWIQRTVGSSGVLDEVDNTVLRAIGFDAADRKRFRSIWLKLSSRRCRRKAIKH